MSLALELSVEAEGWTSLPDPEGLVGRALEAARQTAGVALADQAEVSVLLCDDAVIRKLNAAWRGKDKATNVLSFPAALPGPLRQRSMLGDIAIAWETTAAEADAEGKAVADHVTHLVIHGFLHLIGFDHETEVEAVEMEGLEVRALQGLGLADPYAEQTLERHPP